MIPSHTYVSGDSIYSGDTQFLGTHHFELTPRCQTLLKPDIFEARLLLPD